MKILITHEKFPPDIAGGGETIVLNLVRGLIKKGHDITVLTTGNPKITHYDGIRTIRIPVNRYLMNLSYPIILKYAKGFDLIQTTSGNLCFPSWKVAKTLNKPICVLILHMLAEHWKTIKGRIVGTVFHQLEKLFLGRNYDAVVVMNDNTKILIERINKSSKIYKIPSGFDRIKMKPFKKTKSILFVGNVSMNESMSKLKGLPQFIQAAEHFPSYKFYVVGKGDYLEESKKSAPPNMVFTGSLSGKKLQNLFERSAIFCNLSLSEGFGLTIAEAMAAGCAIISTIDIGQSGYIIRPQNSDALASCIKKLTESPKEIEKFGASNRKLSLQYTWKKFVDGFEKIYEKLV